MNWIDWLVLLGTMLGIAAYGTWRTRGKRDLNHYLKGDRDYGWIVIGISVMATQASAITFLSTPGQGYQDGMGFVQNYFGAPFALILIAAVFLPIYRRMNVYTAYEYLGKRFDTKTRLLGASLFLIQRGIAAGITLYAPAIVLSTVFGWRMDVTILCSGLVVILYTVVGGSEAVTLTQKYQFGVIFIGMIAAFVILLARLPSGLGVGDALTIAGGFQKLNAVDFSIDPNRRYTMWSGLLGGMFLALSYFGTDQTQVQRYIGAASLRESRLGLMFNAVFKIPMQIFILLLGTMLFVFYQFEKPPVFFNETEWRAVAANNPAAAPRMQLIEEEFAQVHSAKQEAITIWLDARRAGNVQAELTAHDAAVVVHQKSEAVRDQARKTLSAADSRVKTNDSDFVFITFILNYLPHGFIGLLVAVFFAATLSSKAGELNALASTTIVDLYRHIRQIVLHDASDRHYVSASKVFTVFWGLVAISFALGASMTENLIEYANIVASLVYGVPLGMFIVAFFLKHVGGTAVFVSGLVVQFMVIPPLYITLKISYLWYNVIGCVGCVVLSLVLQLFLGPAAEPTTLSGEDLPSA